MGVARPGSPVHAGHCQPKAVCVGEVPGPSSNILFFLSSPYSSLEREPGADMGLGAGVGNPEKAEGVFPAIPELTSPPLLVAHLVGLCPLAGHEEALGRGQGEGQVLVDRGPL